MYNRHHPLLQVYERTALFFYLVEQKPIPVRKLSHTYCELFFLNKNHKVKGICYAFLFYINVHKPHKQMTQLCSYFEKGRIIRPNRNYTKRSHRVFDTCYSLQLFTKHICTEFSLIAYLIYSSIFTKPLIYSTSD